MKNPPESYITPADIQERLKVARSTAYEVARQCGPVKFGRVIRVAESAFARWLEEHRRPASLSGGLLPAPRVEPLAYKSLAQRRKEARRAARNALLREGQPEYTIKPTRPRT